MYLVFFCFNDTATTEIYTLSLHDALPICRTERTSVERARTGGSAAATTCTRTRCEPVQRFGQGGRCWSSRAAAVRGLTLGDRKSTRLNSSHANISYAVFCLKKNITPTTTT